MPYRYVLTEKGMQKQQFQKRKPKTTARAKLKIPPELIEKNELVEDSDQSIGMDEIE